MKSLLMLALVFFAVSCNKIVRFFVFYQPITKQQAVNEIRLIAAGKIKKKYGLLPFGTAGQMLNQIQMIGLSFQYRKPIDIVEGRKLLIGAANILLEEINASENVRPYLHHYPFELKDVLIEIFLRNPDDSHPEVGNLVLVEIERGMLIYKTDNLKTNLFTTILKETCDEALQRMADPSLPLASFQPDPKISQEKLEKVCKGISFVSDDGSIWHLDTNGHWVKDQNE